MACPPILTLGLVLGRLLLWFPFIKALSLVLCICLVALERPLIPIRHSLHTVKGFSHSRYGKIRNLSRTTHLVTC